MISRIAVCCLSVLSLAVLDPMCRGQNAPDSVIADFEGENYGTWKVEGEAFGKKPVSGYKLNGVSGYRGRQLVNSFGSGDGATGSLTSPPFEISKKWIVFLIGGGRHPNETGIELLVEGKTVKAATGEDSGQLRWESWDVGQWAGKTAVLRIFDRAKGGWGHINIDQILSSDGPRHGSGTWRLEEYRRSNDYYREPFRPQFHFTPELNWMNDPNGLVYFDGEYHLFYQHNPLGNEWGHMSWGHAVSTDLMHWKHLPIALRDEYGAMIFSGCCVADRTHSSGLSQGGKPPLVALYTGHSPDRQTQDLAFSHDRGRTWTKFAGNPVLDLGEKEFRDPKVFWHEPTKRWVMAVSLAVKKRILFYASTDLKTWALLSEFGPAGVSAKANWECPDLFELPIENEPGKTHWVLKTDMGNGSVAGGSGGEYFTGTFDGKEFKADAIDSQWVDYGRDFYAPVTWSGMPANDGRRIWIGWMNNWETCLNPTQPWRSAMSIPRQLSLRRIDGKLRLCQKPVAELKTLRTKEIALKDLVLRNAVHPLSVKGQQLEIVLEVEPGSAKEVGLRVLKGAKGQTEIGYSAADKSLFVDRTRSGIVDFHPAFAGRHKGPMSVLADGSIRLHLLVDASSVEVFGNDGEMAITDLVFPESGADQVELFAAGGEAKIRSLKVFPLKSAIVIPGTP